MPQFLPDGRVLFTIGSGSSFDSSKVGVLDLKTKQYRAVGQAGAGVRYAPTGHLLYLRSGTLFAQPFDLKRAATTGPEAPVIEGVSTIGPPGTVDYTFSDSGVLVYVTAANNGSQGTTMIWVDRKGGVSPITANRQPWGTGRLSPDGTRIATGLKRATGEMDVWVYDIGRGISNRLSFDGASDNPIWTRDGRRLIYGTSKEGQTGLYSVAADGSGTPEQILKIGSGRGLPTSISPDGKTVVYTGLSANSRSRIMVWTQGSDPRPLHDVPFAEANGILSPDGKWIAYESNESGAQEIYVQPFPGPGAKVRISQQSGSWPRWSANMKELFFWEGAAPVTGVVAVPIQAGASFQAGTPERLFAMTSGTTWDVAPDAKRFLVEQSSITAASSGASMAIVTDWFEELKRRAPAKK